MACVDSMISSEVIPSFDSDSEPEVAYAYIFGRNRDSVQEAKLLVQDIVLLVQEGQLMTAEIKDILDFGLIVKLTRSQEALLHISDISWDPNIYKSDLSQIFCVGQRIDVKVISVDKITGRTILGTADVLACFIHQ